jgi:hypothetical protein
MNVMVANVGMIVATNASNSQVVLLIFLLVVVLVVIFTGDGTVLLGGLVAA